MSAFLEQKKTVVHFHDEESQFRALHQLSDGRHQDDEEEEFIVVVAAIKCFHPVSESIQ